MKTRRRNKPTSSHNRPATHPISTFLADDSPMALAALLRLLAPDKRIAIVGTETEGRKAFRSASTSRADLVLLDRHMPGMDGAEVTRWLKQLRHSPIVVVMTSDDTPEARAKSMAAGADAVVVKAADFASHLQAAIRSLFGRQSAGKKGRQTRVRERITPIK